MATTPAHLPGDTVPVLVDPATIDIGTVVWEGTVTDLFDGGDDDLGYETETGVYFWDPRFPVQVYRLP